MERARHVFVAGGSGALGRRLIPPLLAAGHRVTATAHDPAKLDALRRLGADAVVMNGLYGPGVAEAVARARPDVIVHEMTSLAGVSDLMHFDRTFAKTNALRTRGTEHLLAAARAAGVRRFVAQSYAGWPTAPAAGSLATEEDPWNPDPPRLQRESLAALQALERAVTGASLHGIALRYGNFYGPGASDALVDLVRRRRLPLVGDGGGVWSWIHLDDAAAATVAAVEGGEAGIYNVVDDDPAPVAAWLPDLAAAVGAPAPRHLPVWLARLGIGEVGVAMMTRVHGAANAKAKRALGWRPRWPSWREGFRAGLGGDRPAARVAAVDPRPTAPAAG